MRLALILTLASLATVFAFSGQIPGRLVSREIHSEDWTISDWSAVRLGQLSISHLNAGDELQVYSLATVPRPAPSGSFHSARPACDGDCYEVSAFDHGNTNQLKGYFSSYEGAPSSAQAGLQRWQDGRRALTMDFSRAGSGYCGMWIHFFDSRRPISERVYLDTSDFSVVTFWVRGLRGGERLLLKAADAQWERNQDALAVGDVGSFLPKGRIDEDWQQAIIPLARFPRRLNMRQLAALNLEAVEVGRGKVAIKDLAFCRNRDHLVPLSPPDKTASELRDIDKALWIWNTAGIINRAGERQALVDFCLRNGFSHLFLQLPNDGERFGTAGEITLEVQSWRVFLRLLNNSGLHVYALDGLKDYALPEYHERVLKTVDNVIRYNQWVEPDERFHGIHYDIEPYLLPGFQGSRRQSIMAGLLDLLRKLAAKTRSAGMIFGVDIPFWYDSPDELTGQAFQLEFNGRRKYADEHIIDLVDHVAVMDYRTSAYGADGIVGLVEAELAYAAEAGKKVFVGLETGDLPDEDLIEFEGEPGRGLPEKPLADSCVVLQVQGGRSVIWAAARSRWAELRERLQKKDAGVSSLLWWPVIRTVHVPASKLTFAGLGADRLRQVMTEALEELARYPSFAGYALHDYVGYRKLLDALARK